MLALCALGISERNIKLSCKTGSTPEMDLNCKAANNTSFELQHASTINDIVDIIFSKPAQPAKSLQFQLEGDSADSSDASKLQDICHFIAMKGVMKLYGISNLLQIDCAQASKIMEYMASIGIKMHITCNMEDSSPYDVSDRGEALQSIQLKYTFI